MPELPEVETMVRGIRPAVEGRTLRAVRACPCACRPITVLPGLAAIDRRTHGQRVERVRRLAKRVLLELASGEAFVIEPRMTGLMLLKDPPDIEHLRIEWCFEQGRRRSSVWFWDRRGLGTVSLLSAAELAELEAGGRLGPDPIELSEADWRAAFEQVRRPIKVALLDQSRVAGIGNLYASEILHRAAIHPERRCDELKRSDWSRLQAAAREILLEAIAYEGSTLSDGTYRNVLNQDGGYQNAHRVYDREDERCRTCSRGTIRRFVQAQRSTFFCPICQRPPRDGRTRQNGVAAASTLPKSTGPSQGRRR